MSTNLRALEWVVTAIRPDWDAPGVRVQLDAATREGVPFADIAHAAVDAARTPSTRTPAGIGERLRGGWRTDAPYDQPTPMPPPIEELWRTLPPEHERRQGPSPEQRELIARGLRRFG